MVLGRRADKGIRSLKPWPNGQANSRKWTQVELAQRLVLGGQTARKFLRKYTQVAKKDILRQTILLANNRLMDVTQLALTWVGWPNGEKLASTCVQI